MLASAGEYGRCRRCGDVVLWVVMGGSGKAMRPSTPEPSDDGTVAITRSPGAGLVGRVVTAQVPARHFERLHVTHFATCAPRLAHRQGLRDGTVVDLARARRTREST